VGFVDTNDLGVHSGVTASGAWFDINSLGAGVEDGSALDRNVLSLLMLLAAAVLISRKVAVRRWIGQNQWLLVFLSYCLVSVVWSDFPAIALKRWIRALGGIAVIMVALSEADPIAAIGSVIRRCAYVLVPFSVLLIKYYRELGVTFDTWTGQTILVGVTTDKNALGRLCLVTGLFAVWNLIVLRRSTQTADRLSVVVRIVVLGTTMWLMRIAGSATSLVTFLMGTCIIVGLGMSSIRSATRFLGTGIVAAAAVMLTANASFNLAETFTASLGRDMTLTDRTFIWADLLAMGTNPLIGVGYDSFWLGERLQRFLNQYRVSTAHNGYLEIYLELGVVGLSLFFCFLLSTFFTAKKLLTSSFDHGRLRLAMLAVFCVYNLTESGYKVTTFIFFVLLLVSMNIPAPVAQRVGGRLAAQFPRKRIPTETEVVPGPLRKSLSNSTFHAQGHAPRRYSSRETQVPRVVETRRGTKAQSSDRRHS
jgi:O-antigen ligase